MSVYYPVLRNSINHTEPLHQNSIPMATAPEGHRWRCWRELKVMPVHRMHSHRKLGGPPLGEVMVQTDGGAMESGQRLAAGTRASACSEWSECLPEQIAGGETPAHQKQRRMLVSDFCYHSLLCTK